MTSANEARDPLLAPESNPMFIASAKYVRYGHNISLSDARNKPTLDPVGTAELAIRQPGPARPRLYRELSARGNTGAVPYGAQEQRIPMDPIVTISEHADFLKRLGLSPPASLAGWVTPVGSATAEAAAPIVLRFAYRDVPFVVRIERDGKAAILQLSGKIGPLPFTAQAARRRRRALFTLAAAGSTSLNWRVSARQEIEVDGAITLARPLTPVAMVAGIVRLLLEGERYLDLLLEVLGEVLGEVRGEGDALTSPRAA
jgi:hypothetical protein